MSQPLVSVCITTYNQRDYILECLESAFQCAGEIPIEIIVGDDASDDGTSEIVEAFAQRTGGIVRHVRHDIRLGAFRNYDHVIALARAPLIAHLDGDDYWLPGKLVLQVSFMQGNPDCAAVYTNAVTIDERGRRLGVFNNVQHGEWTLEGMLERGNFLNTSSMVFRTHLRKSLLAINGPYLDYLMHLRFAQHGKLVQLPGEFVAYRIDARGSMVSTMGGRVRELYWASILDVPKDLASERSRARGMADFLRRVILRDLRAGHLQSIMSWVGRVAGEAPCSFPLLAALVASSLAHVAARHAARRLGTFGGAPPVMVIR
ncbi:glycosyltransferase family 2 protein [Luteimonas fraxinea]|uniref:glycosyltransferase family 2 protein n=1 Tax=Luteimonas fraxinea TaxID=2901869 RepID=UPI001E53F14D|nr:glycosyltransferase [Luteimonas fraxinea]MCD9124383.1 glycosyltransferase [Luteimonas fraxinea]